MKKLFFFFIFLSTFSVVKAQIGIGFYPLSNAASIRWNPKVIVRDSSKALFETNYNYHFELRSSFTFSHNSRHTTFSSQPECAFFHSFAGKTGSPMLYSGLGIFVSMNHYGVNNKGVFLPLLLEYVPKFNFTHNISFDLETDLMFSFKSDSYNVKFRPLVSVAWIFSPPSAKGH